MVREPDATRQPTLHDIQLVSKHRVLSFKPQLRLEWRGQDGQSETEQPDHSASLGDSITASTRIRFRYTQTIMVREPDATRQPTLHDIQLMSKHRVLSLKPQLRLERRGQGGQNETEQPDHPASLGDSVALSTRIGFSVHTMVSRLHRLRASGCTGTMSP